MPSGRRFALLPLFGMYTRLTGRATNGSELRCTRSAKSALASGVSTTSPSTPAVKRPALRSVTLPPPPPPGVVGAEPRLHLRKTAALGKAPRLRRREDPLPQPPYALLDRTPVNLAPVENLALWSVHHDIRRGV